MHPPHFLKPENVHITISVITHFQYFVSENFAKNAKAIHLPR